MQMDLLLGQDCSSPQCTSSSGRNRDGSLSRTSPDYSAAIKGGTLVRWLESWLGSRLVFQQTDGKTPVWQSAQKDLSSGQFWTRNSCEWNPVLAPCLKDEGVSSLSEILETGEIDRRYFLTAKACKGILRRAEKRGKELPQALARALEAVAESGCQTKSCSVKTGGA